MLAQADVGPKDFGITTTDPNYTTIQSLKPSFFLVTLLNLLLGIAGVASFVYLLWGGVQWITAGGDKDGIEKARKKIMAALLGLTIVFSAYAILFIMRTFFNVNLIQFSINPLSDSGGSAAAAAVGYGGTGGTGGGGTDPSLVGSTSCPGCTDGGYGVAGTIYIGATAGSCYLCDAADGWVLQPASTTCSSQSCGHL